MYNFDLILEDIVDWFERNLSLIPTEGWFNFTHKAFLKGSLFALPAWFMYIVSIVCVLRYILIFVTNWVKWFLHKPKSQPVDMKPDSDDPAFTVRLEVLKGKASRVSAKIWKELEDMEKGGMSSPNSGSARSPFAQSMASEISWHRNRTARLSPPTQHWA